MSDAVKGLLLLVFLALVFGGFVTALIVAYQGNEKEVGTITIESVEFIPGGWAQSAKTKIQGDDGWIIVEGHIKQIPSVGTKVKVYEDTWNNRSRVEVVK